MAKRKRLTPAQPDYLSAAPEVKSALGPGSISAPIAQVAGEAASTAALSDLVEVVETARAKGLMIEELPLKAIDGRHLVRDRLDQDEEEMAALMASLRARGQQTPIEVVELDDPAFHLRYGLISGWRRLAALTRLFEETGDETFATIRAIVIRPDSAAAAYVAMVEENEIRVDLSFYERARIAVRALKEGVFPSKKDSLRGLFGNATRSRRSKIGSFIPLVEALDAVLHYPSAISEKLGLALSRELSGDPGFAERLVQSLKAGKRDSAAAELKLLGDALKAQTARKSSGTEPKTEPDQPQRPRIRSLEPEADERHITRAAAGVSMAYSAMRNRIELNGPGVTPALMEDLQDWLKRR